MLFMKKLVLAVVMATAVLAIAIHAPGQVSMDSSMQLYEAHIGQSVSWNPPFMSALMRWLGGGELATTMLVLLNSLLTYLAFGQVVLSALRAREESGSTRIAWWRAALCVLVVLNPIVFIYVGIVWKDVFFASLLTAAVSLGFAAAVSERSGAILRAALSMILLAIAVKVRQQGIFMAPVLALVPLIAALSGRGWHQRQKVMGGIGLVFVFLATSFVIDGMVSRTIAGSGDKSSSVGFRAIMNFDIAGAVVMSSTPTDKLPVKVTQEQRNALLQSYSSNRVDTLDASPVASAWLNGFTDETRKHVWRELWKDEPSAILKHRLSIYKAVLDVNGIQGCLPVHIGVDGNPNYLQAVGMASTRDSRDLFVYSLASKFFRAPMYRHWCYVLALVVVTGLLVAVKMPARFKAMGLVVAAATGLFYLSFLPTAISCDFRYMYSGVCLVMLLWLLVLAGGIAGGLRRQSSGNENHG